MTSSSDRWYGFTEHPPSRSWTGGYHTSLQPVTTMGSLTAVAMSTNLLRSEELTATVRGGSRLQICSPTRWSSPTSRIESLYSLGSTYCMACSSLTRLISLCPPSKHTPLWPRSRRSSWWWRELCADISSTQARQNQVGRWPAAGAPGPVVTF